MSQEDRAQDEELFRWALLNQPRTPEKTYEPDDKEYGPEFCINEDCGEPMPALRRASGRKTCTDCAAAAERKIKRGY